MEFLTRETDRQLLLMFASHIPSIVMGLEQQ